VQTTSYGPQACRRLLRATYGVVVDRILDDESTRGVVLCSRDNADALHGYAVASDDALHFVYLPPELRGRGYGRRLVSEALGGYPETITVTHPWPWQSRRYRWDHRPLARLCGHERAA
jgi:GNAT superfamily N-acetyltransferase